MLRRGRIRSGRNGTARRRSRFASRAPSSATAHLHWPSSSRSCREVLPVRRGSPAAGPVLRALRHAGGRSSGRDAHGAARERRRPAAAPPDGACRGIRSGGRAGARRDGGRVQGNRDRAAARGGPQGAAAGARPHGPRRAEEHTSELQSRLHLVCRLLLEKKKIPEMMKRMLVRLITLHLEREVTAADKGWLKENGYPS